ncbi:ABC transporter permease [Burkholderia sp. Bp9125]|nr:ABC transporter permease [Burkholderia sp. Bp9125]
MSAIGLFFFVFLYAPILVLVALSFNSGGSATVWEGFGVSGYRDAFANPAALEAARTSLVVAAIAASVATILGTAAAIALWLDSSPRKTFVEPLLLTPLWIPEICLAVGTLIVLSTLRIRPGLHTVIFGHTVFCLPFAYFPVQATLARFDRTLLDAAADLGAAPLMGIRSVVLPLVLPGVAAGFMLAFMVSMDDFVTTYFLSNSDTVTLPAYIYGMIRWGVKPDVNALATSVLLASFIFSIASVLIARRVSAGRPITFAQESA